MNPSLIVCPIESVADERAAVAHALVLARWYDASLHVLEVGGDRRRHEGVEAARTRLADAISELNTHGVDVTVVTTADDPAEYVRSHNADLVVVAQHARRGSRYWPAGSFATAFARSVPCPTLAVPREADVPPDDPPFRRIIVGVDSSQASMAALNQALTLAQQNAGRITLLHVLEGFPYETVYSSGRAMRLADEYGARVSQVRRELLALVPPDAFDWCEVETDATTGIPHEAILAAAAARNADLIVVGLPRRARLEEVLTGSAVRGVVRQATCPVLMVPGSPRVTARLTDIDAASAAAEPPALRIVAAPSRPGESATW